MMRLLSPIHVRIMQYGGVQNRLGVWMRRGEKCIQTFAEKPLGIHTLYNNEAEFRRTTTRKRIFGR
jgi:hypothetical protein